MVCNLLKKSYNTMEFKVKDVLILVALIPLLIYLIFSSLSISKTFLTMEKKQIKENLSQAERILQFKGEALSMLLRSYASCETAYKKMAEREIDWFRQNYGYRLYQKYEIDFAIVLDEDGQVFHQYVFFEGGHLHLLQNKGENFSAISQNKEEEIIHGLLKYGKDLYIIAAAPLKPANMEATGTILFGKKVTPKLLRYIEENYGYKMLIFSTNTVITPYEVLGGVEENLQNSIDTIDVKEVEEQVMSKTVLKDLFGTPIGELVLIQSWDFHLSTLSLMHKNAFRALLISITIIIVLLSIWLNKFIMQPLKKIRNSIQIMGTSQSLNYIEVEGPDEIMDLAKNFNIMVKNIQDEKKLNEDLREKLEYDHLKNEFLANVSHELRTPLNVILSSLQLWELEMKDNQQQVRNNKQLKIMKQNCYRLLRLANNLIDMTKIDAGFFELRRKNHNIVSVVEDITMSVSKYIESHQIDLIFDTEIEEKFIFCDPDKIERVILNLLSNAVKCTKPGGKIEIVLQDQKDKVLILVKDTGIGIQEEKQKVIFERFRQVEDLLRRQHEGSGLGLTLTKSLVEMHEGTISLKSKFGEGATFTIELPVTAGEDITDKEPILFTKEDGLGPSQLERIGIEFSDIYYS